MTALQEQVRYSIEQCILEHLDQDVNRESAVREASIEITKMLMRPIDALDEIDRTLTVPAAEYVPAIGDAFRIIGRTRKAIAAAT